MCFFAVRAWGFGGVARLQARQSFGQKSSAHWYGMQP